MIWKTEINEITKTKYPLIMAAFARLSNINFASAFSEAGGLGIITALNYPVKNFKQELESIRSLTDKPLGVNITVVPPEVSTPHGKLTEDDYLKYVETALDEDILIFTTSAYQAGFIGKRVKEAGCYWFHKSSTMKHAFSAEKAGADAITLVGLEASGFKNPYQNTTLVNLTMANQLLKIPIIAAGGIGDAHGFLACLAMGAHAVCLGSAILTAEECPAPPTLKESWLQTDVLSSDYYKKLYHFSLKGTMVPSPAIKFQKEILPLKEIIASIISNAEDLIISWGFNINSIDFSNT